VETDSKLDGTHFVAFDNPEESAAKIAAKRILESLQAMAGTNAPFSQMRNARTHVLPRSIYPKEKSRSLLAPARPTTVHGYAAFLAVLTLAHLAFWATAIFRRADALMTRTALTVRVCALAERNLAHRAFWAAAILERAAAVKPPLPLLTTLPLADEPLSPDSTFRAWPKLSISLSIS
jgi:hypothetical protein